LELRSADPTNATVSEIAAGWGLTDPRSFLSQFGILPSGVLGSGFPPDNEADDDGKHPIKGNRLAQAYASWLRDAVSSPYSAG